MYRTESVFSHYLARHALLYLNIMGLHQIEWVD